MNKQTVLSAHPLHPVKVAPRIGLPVTLLGLAVLLTGLILVSVYTVSTFRPPAIPKAVDEPLCQVLAFCGYPSTAAESLLAQMGVSPIQTAVQYRAPFPARAKAFCQELAICDTLNQESAQNIAGTR